MHGLNRAKDRRLTQHTPRNAPAAAVTDALVRGACYGHGSQQDSIDQRQAPAKGRRGGREELRGMTATEDQEGTTGEREQTDGETITRKRGERGEGVQEGTTRERDGQTVENTTPGTAK